MVDPRDELLQSVTPIVVAPLFAPPLAPLRGSCHRFIVAQNGIWLELVRPWVRVVTKVSDGPVVKLPAGSLEEELQIPHAIPRSLLDEFLRRAQARPHLEQAAFITINPFGKFELVDVGIISNGAEHINYRCPRLRDGHEMVLDLHSHAKLPAFFSDEDDHDDNEMVKIAAVVGNCDHATPTLAARLCVLGKFIPLPL